MLNPRIVFIAAILAITNACKTRAYDNVDAKNSSASTSAQSPTCRSTESQSIAVVCVRENHDLNHSAVSPSQFITEALTKGAVDCASSQPHQKFELLVDESSVALHHPNGTPVKASRDGVLERNLTSLNVLPIGTCEAAFKSQLISYSAIEDYKLFFKQKDGSVPNIFYRGVGLPDDAVAGLISPLPQMVLETWAYSRIRATLPPERQYSTLSALTIREKIYQSLWTTLVPSLGTAEEIVAMITLQSEAMSRTVVGAKRSTITSRAFSVSSLFSQAYAYSIMNASAEKIGFVLAYRNSIGRNMYVLGSEWSTFSHVPKSDEIAIYLVIPVGETAIKQQVGGEEIVLYKEYEFIRVTGLGQPSAQDLKIAKCNPFNKPQDSEEMPTCGTEISASQMMTLDFSDRAKKIITKATSQLQ